MITYMTKKWLNVKIFIYTNLIITSQYFFFYLQKALQLYNPGADINEHVT